MLYDKILSLLSARYYYNYLFIQLMESIKRDINSNTRKLSADTKYIVELALNQEVSLITQRFKEIKDMKTRVCKLACNLNYV
jgi:hypothetical protein